MTERLSDLSAAVDGRREHARVAAPRRPRRDRRTARRHRRRPDGPARPGLTARVARPAQSRWPAAGYGDGTADRRAGRRRSRGGWRRTANGSGHGAACGAGGDGRCVGGDHPARRRHRGAAGSAGRRPAARAPAAQCGRPQPRARRGAARVRRCSAAHLVAIVAGAALIAAVDRLCARGVACGAGRRANRLPAGAATAPVSATACADQPLRSALLLAASVSHRGPPVSLAR